MGCPPPPALRGALAVARRPCRPAALTLAAMGELSINPQGACPAPTDSRKSSWGPDLDVHRPKHVRPSLEIPTDPPPKTGSALPKTLMGG